MKHIPWETLSKQMVLRNGSWIEVELHTVRLPDGRIIQDWPWVKTPDFINVLPVTEKGEILCFRQMKYAFEEPSLAPVGGYIEIGEDPFSAAQRELLEETGYQSKEWVNLYSGWMDPNRGMAKGHLFLANNVYKVTEPHADDLEEQELLFLSLDEVWSALEAGEFKVIAWALNISLALKVLGSKKIG